MPRIQVWRETIRRGLSLSLPTAVAVLLGLALCATPSILMWDELVHNPIGGDDFVYIARSRTFPRLVSSLWIPHNAHVAPLFRIWTYLLIQIAGSLERLPTVLAFGSYLPLVLAMLAGGHLIARESGRLTYGLIAMAWIGVNSVLEPVVAWYSSSQALWAGTAVLAMLCLLQSWRAHGGWRRVSLALALTISAGWFWSAGYLAGPAGFAYLWFDRRGYGRKTALLPLIAGVVGAVIAIVLSGGGPFASVNFDNRSALSAADPLKGLVYCCQAIPEGIVLGNFGVDGAIETTQGIVLMLAIALIWIRSRLGNGARPLPNSLEASGATLTLGAAMLSYTFRSYLPFDSLRTIWVYYALPQLGSILFAAGWLIGLRKSAETSTTLRPVRRIEAIGLFVLTLAIFFIHQPRSTRLFLLSAPPTLEEEGIWAAKPMLRPRAIFLLDDKAERQRLWLARLDQAEKIADREGIDRASIRRVFGRVIGSSPEWPVDLREFDATDLLIMPPRSKNPPSSVAVRSALAEYLFNEPEAKPPWLKGARVNWPPARSK